jgi:serine/threonine protein kinase
MVGPGTVLKTRWRLTRKVGQGAFGEIYSGVDVTNDDPVAVKLERWDNKKAVLKMEVAVLKKLQHCQYACRYVHCGHFEDHNYLVMELLGENLSELRRRCPGGRFSLATTVRYPTRHACPVSSLCHHPHIGPQPSFSPLILSESV